MTRRNAAEAATSQLLVWPLQSSAHTATAQVPPAALCLPLSPRSEADDMVIHIL